MKQIKVLNYHVNLLPKLLNDLALNANDRKLRKKLYQILQNPAQLMEEQLAGLREQHADVDEKGSKVVKEKSPNGVIYQFTGENLQNLNQAFVDLMNTVVKIDILPADEEYLEPIADLLENADFKLNRLEENAVEGLALVLRGTEVEVEPEEEEKEKEEKK